MTKRNRTILEKTMHALVTFNSLPALLLACFTCFFLYILLHFWITLNHSAFFIRSFSAFFAVACVFVFYKIGKLIFNKTTATISSILLSLNMFFVFYAQDARSYSLMLFLTCVSLYSFLRYKENKFYKILYIISSILAIYAHIYAIFVILSQYIFVILKRKSSKYIFSFIAISLFLLPLIVAPAMYNGQINWIPKPTLSSILSLFFLLGGDFLPLSIVTLLLLTYALLKRANLLLLLCFFTPIICSIAISFIKPIFVPLYLIVSLPPFLLLVGNALDKIKNKKILVLLLSLIFLFSGVRLFLWYTSNSQEFFLSKIKYIYINNVNEDWKDATNYVTDHANYGDIAIFYGYFGKLDYDFYAKQNSPRVVEIASKPYSLGGGKALPTPNTSLITSFKNPDIWFIVNRNEGTQFNAGEQYSLIESLLQKHYKKVLVVSFPQVSVEKFSYR